MLLIMPALSRQPSSSCQTIGCITRAIGCIFGFLAGPWDTILTMHAAASLPRWFWISSIWLAIGLFDATQTVYSMRAQGMHHAWGALFLTLLLFWLTWAAATPLIVRLGRRYPPVRVKPLSTWFVHLAVVTAIGVVGAAWNAGLEKLLNPWADPRGPGSFLHLWTYKFNSGWLTCAFLYASILAMSYVLESRERLARQQTEAARLNEQLSKAQLNALRRQIEPHFLFNTLNAISGLVREQRNDAAVRMIAGLSDFLRRVIEDSDRQEVPLREEVEFLQTYLDIQKVRFADRLHIVLDIPREFLPAQVPSLLLQPLVENAIKHGIAKRAQEGTIRIAASRSNGMLTLSVYNDGPGFEANREKTDSGIGLSNMRSRLQSLYGDAFQLSMQDQNPGGVQVSVSVPFREE
jgi:two-component system, LytTR family, sensor kinase